MYMLRCCHLLLIYSIHSLIHLGIHSYPFARFFVAAYHHPPLNPLSHAHREGIERAQDSKRSTVLFELNLCHL
ncbi:hypothetical protein V8C34DRAFT_282312 [Trichoderma compactum]